MRNTVLLMVLLFNSLYVHGQISYDVLSSVPEAVSNNAVSAVEVDGEWFVYSFAGINSTKSYSGIHSKVFRYDVSNDTWMTMPELPSGPVRIAAGASTVQGKIYVLGGYQVFANGSEVSVEKMHVYDPVLDVFEADAVSIPKAIDDHVQCVYKDSLIYVVTGWSNTGNVSDVWMYDVTEDSWAAGTSIPMDNDFQAFGASGTIIGDTIYFIGGARDVGSFGLISTLRKGYINPADPTNINWSMETVEEAGIYRAGASALNGQPIWLGGSENTYNYNGIAYNGAGGVPSTNSLVYYETDNGILTKEYADFPLIMDLRGLAKVGDNSFISVGGMQEGQQVTDRVVRYEIGQLVSEESIALAEEFHIYPSPSSGIFKYSCPDYFSERPSTIQIYDRLGRLVYSRELLDDSGEVNLSSEITNGIYSVVFVQEGREVFSRQLVLSRE